MWCHFWRFNLRNTLKLARKKKKNVKESATLFFKTTLFFFHRVLTSFFTCSVQHSNIPSKKKLPDKTGEKNAVSDLAILAQKYPKIVSQEEKKFQEIHNTVFQNYVVFYSILTLCFTCLWS